MRNLRKFWKWRMMRVGINWDKWHHWFNGHQFEQAPGVGKGQGRLVCCSPWGPKNLDMIERLNNKTCIMILSRFNSVTFLTFPNPPALFLSSFSFLSNSEIDSSKTFLSLKSFYCSHLPEFWNWLLAYSMEKAMAPLSSTLAWKIPRTEEPGRLQSMGSLGVGHDRVTSLSLFTFMHWRRKWQPSPVFLPGESQGRGSLVGCHLWGRTESDMTEAA